ncbi:MAG: hypothetical protein ACRDG6_10385 [Candidatus Limnocylindria bacterium]
MTGTLRIVTSVNALIYFAAAIYHSGVLSAAGASAPAAIAEALLGLVLVAALMGVLSPWSAYGVAFAGTLLGLAVAFALLFSARQAARST